MPARHPPLLLAHGEQFISKLSAVSVCLGGWMADRDTAEFVLLGEKSTVFKIYFRKVHFLSEHQIVTKQNVTTDFRRKY